MIVNRITQCRIAAGLTPAEISNMFKIPYNVVQKWEKGELKPPAWAEQQIVNKLNSFAKNSKSYGTMTNPFKKQPSFGKNNFRQK